MEEFNFGFLKQLVKTPFTFSVAADYLARNWQQIVSSVDDG